MASNAPIWSMNRAAICQAMDASTALIAPRTSATSSLAARCFSSPSIWPMRDSSDAVAFLVLLGVFNI